MIVVCLIFGLSGELTPPVMGDHTVFIFTSGGTFTSFLIEATTIHDNIKSYDVHLWWPKKSKEFFLQFG
jgi:hypothetical protein